MRPVQFVVLSGALSLLLAGAVWAEPAWTRTGNCQSCHDVLQPGLVDVYGHDGLANPNGNGLYKVVQVLPGQSTALLADVAGLSNGDGYGVELTQFRYRGIMVDHRLEFDEDCSWADWGGTAGTFSDPALHDHWGSGPTGFQFDIFVRNETVYDYYELVYAVAGKNDSGELFYDEEAFYLQVTDTLNLAPTVTMSGPTNGQVFGPGDEIVLAASPSDSDGFITKVEFFEGQTLLAETTSPYSHVWADVPAGDYEVTAVTTDNGGMAAVSEPVNITVKGIPGDADGDGDVDQADFGQFQRCLSGADVEQTDPGCEVMQLDGDTDVDGDDYTIFEQCSSGPEVEAYVNCAN